MTTEANSEAITRANNRISSLITLTPVQTSSSINSIIGKNVFFKCENFQKTGSFKVRGIFNKLQIIDSKSLSKNLIK